jgi:hypothetical protein
VRALKTDFCPAPSVWKYRLASDPDVPRLANFLMPLSGIKVTTGMHIVIGNPHSARFTVNRVSKRLPHSAAH